MPETYQGDCLEIMPLLAGGYHAVITDPPYHLQSIVKRFGGANAAPAQHGTDGAFARASRGFMGKCFHPATDILTATGWKPVGEVQLGEVVATLDPKTSSLVWQAVAETHCYPFEGQLIHLKHRSAEQMVTPNHNVFLASFEGPFRFQRADSMPRTFYQKAQCAPVAGKHDLVSITSTREYGKDRTLIEETRAFDPEAFFYFFGLWLGDGWTVCRKDDHPANDFCGLFAKKPRKIRAFRSAIEALGVRYKESDGCFYIYDFPLLGFLKTLGGAKEKHIPEFLYAWDQVYLERLYLGLIETDGTVQRGGQEVFFTSSRSLADCFQRLCLLVGRSCSIKEKPAGRGIINSVAFDHGPQYVCCALQRGKSLYGENSDRRGNIVNLVDYRGPVYCVGVLEYHLIYTRFNGRPVWSGNSWDGGDIAHNPEVWKLCYDLLLPGGYLAAFSSPRTGHRMACAIEDAGFIMHPFLGWIYGSGMPKAVNPAKALDRRAGVEGKFRGTGQVVRRIRPGADQNKTGSWEKLEDRTYEHGTYLPASEAAQQWEGWRHGTQAQKPALEPIYLAQKPISEKTMADNLLRWGVGCVNIDGCRTEDGRWPANVMHDGLTEDWARFFYCAKANAAEREGTTHATVKPQALMRWLCRHLTPPGGKILDPFAGSGSTGIAAVREGFNTILIEQDANHYRELQTRLEAVCEDSI